MPKDFSALRSFAGYYKDTEMLRNVSSGGTADVLARTILKMGGVVFGVAYTEDFYGTEYRMITKLEELEQLRGSKYVSAKREILLDGQKVPVFKAVEQCLSEGKKVLFIGLSCDVGGLNMYLARREVGVHNLYLVDLFCWGTLPNAAYVQYIKGLEKKFSSKIVSFSMRYKKYGWKIRYIRAVFANGKIWEDVFEESDLGIAFYTFANPGCYMCKFKGENRCADITVGDYWGVDKSSLDYNPMGVSSIIVTSEKGLHLLKEIDPMQFYLHETNDETLLRGYCRSSLREKTKNYELFVRLFEEHGLHYACVHTVGCIKYYLYYSTHIRAFLKRRLLTTVKDANLHK